MKARIPTQKEISSKLTLQEILRVNKIWIYTISRCIRISKERLCDLYANVCQFSGEVYEDPELWVEIDEHLLGKLDLGEAFEPEDYDERERASKTQHKEDHKKWRMWT